MLDEPVEECGIDVLGEPALGIGGAGVTVGGDDGVPLHGLSVPVTRTGRQGSGSSSVGSLPVVDDDEARTLLREERRRVEELLDATLQSARDDRDAANDDGDFTDPAQGLNSEQVDDAIVASLQERLAAIARAENRLADGTYGSSVRSGAPIPDERLRADPAAELTVEEAQASG